jgi:hypothetical protein
LDLVGTDYGNGTSLELSIKKSVGHSKGKPVHEAVPHEFRGVSQWIIAEVKCEDDGDGDND